MRRKIVIAVVVLILLGVVASAAWTLFGWPPPRLILKYGLTPSCEPTGNTLEVEGIEFVEIGPGCFRMGSHYHCEEGDLLGRVSTIVGLNWGTLPRHGSNECPPHWVEFERGFWIARTEVTNAQFERFNTEHERSEYSPGDRHPVVNVSWEDAKAFCAWLSERSGRDVRLPGEAMWEASCRGGSEAEFCFGDDAGRLGQYGWYDTNSQGQAHEVGTRRKNGWGLNDLHGNVREWCWDAYPQSLKNAALADVMLDADEHRCDDCQWQVQRGGDWDYPAEWCRNADLDGDCRTSHTESLGFRPAIWPSND